jgi:hypothetical protein
MKEDNRWRMIAAWILTTVLFACAGASGGSPHGKKLPVEVIAEGKQCLPASETWTATWIASRNQLDGFVSRCRSHRLGFHTTSMNVDFDRYRVMALEMGQRLSAGYGFHTRRVAAFLQGNTAVVSVSCHEPGFGGVPAQVLTSPWILIRLPMGSYRTVRVVDQNGRQLVNMAPCLQ